MKEVLLGGRKEEGLLEIPSSSTEEMVQNSRKNGLALFKGQ